MVEVIKKDTGGKLPYYRMTIWMTQEECMNCSWFSFFMDRPWIKFCVAQGLEDDQFAIWVWGPEALGPRETGTVDKIGKITFERGWPIPVAVHNEALRTGGGE